jgi:hypothetical protein
VEADSMPLGGGTKGRGMLPLNILSAKIAAEVLKGLAEFRGGY